MQKRVKVLIIDDSVFIRRMLCQELLKYKDIEVVGTAKDPYEGRDKIVFLKPDIVLLDVEMPRMDGLTFLSVLMKYYPIPVIIISSLIEKRSELVSLALERGAVEVIEKPNASHTYEAWCQQLVERIRLINSQSEKKVQTVIAIGASTGGTEAIKEILIKLPSFIPPILIVQHMPQNFTKSFAERLNALTNLCVKEAEQDEILSPGKVLIAPGNHHMVLRKNNKHYYVAIEEGPLVFHQRPSVEYLFESVAKYAGANAIGIMLTGMGKDGAEGLLKMRQAGAFTIAQDEKSCVVYGMPKEAVQIGAVKKIIALDNIAECLMKQIAETP